MQEQLKKLIDTILMEGQTTERSFEAVNAMQKLYAAHANEQIDDLDDAKINLPSGLAISSRQAALCLVRTPMRSIAFLRGIHKALLKLREEHPGERLNIFYAGCGPYASLVTPFAALYGPEELSFYLLDINPRSLDSAKKLYNSLGIAGYVKAWICDDAATCSLPQDNLMHIVVSETMLRALEDEPQVSIMLNLIPQMASAAVFIPEEIGVSVKLLSPESVAVNDYIGDFDTENISLGLLYSIGRHYCHAPMPATIKIPMNYGRFTTLSLFTEIKVYAGETLKAYSSELNKPVLLCDVSGKPGVNVMFEYELTSKPGFKYKWEDFSFPRREPPKRIYIGQQENILP